MDWYKKAKSEWEPVKSSWITNIVYNKLTGNFKIKLKNGKEYVFEDVPSNVYEDFIKAKSKGEFFNRIIKEKYGTTVI